MKKILHVVWPVILAAMATSSCGSGSRPGADDQEAHDHGAQALSYTLFQGNYELFVEFLPLVKGEPRSFAAHFTRLSDYRPVTEGRLGLTLSDGKQVITASAEAPSSPGIFRPTLTPPSPGEYALLFELTTGDTIVKCEIPGITVFGDSHEAAHSPAKEALEQGIVYLKEQAWKTEFRTEEVQLKPFHEVIHTSALVKSKPQAEAELTAPSGGSVSLLVVPGQQVKQGEVVAVISGSGLETNFAVRINEARIAYEKSRSDYLRTKPLTENQTVSQKEFVEIRSRYQRDSLLYHQMAGSVTQERLHIRAPFSGFISDVLVTSGAFAENGEPVVRMSDASQVLIEAYVNQSDFRKVEGIFDARFRLPSVGDVLTLEELSGKVKAATVFVPGQSTRIPVTFLVSNNGQLMPGMFVEAFLLTGRKEEAMVIPLSALIEETGRYSVFVQTGGESFVKRAVEPAGNDGLNTEIVAGLRPGERIVTLGAYQIKLASLSGELPLHGHTH